MALPLSLLEIRREQRRVACLLGASKQLDIHVRPYRGIPSQNLFRSKHHRQLKRGKVDQTPVPASTSLPEYHTKPKEKDPTDGRKSNDEEFIEHSKPFIPAGTSRNNYQQLFSRHAFAGHQGDLVPSTLREVGKGMCFSFPIAQDGDIFLASSKNVPKKLSSPKKDLRVPSKEDYNHDDFARTTFTSNVKPAAKKPRPKRKIPPDLDTTPPRQPKELLTDYRLPKPKKSESLPTLPVPKDTSFAPKRTFSPKPRPAKRYHQDIIGQGVDVPLQTDPDPPIEQTVAPVKQDVKHNKVSPSIPSIVKDVRPPPLLTRKPSNIFEGFHRYKPKPHDIPPEKSEQTPLPKSDSMEEMDDESELQTESETITNSDKEVGEDEEEDDGSSDEEMEEHNSPNPSFQDPIWERPPTRQNDNPWSEAYRKAVAAARRRNLPTLDDYNHRFTRAFTYSYFPNGHDSTCQCNNCLQNKAAKEKTKGRKKKSKKQKARSEMKKILGNVKIYDYFKFAPKKS